MPKAVVADNDTVDNAVLESEQSQRIATLERELENLTEQLKVFQDNLPNKQRRKMRLSAVNRGKEINVPFYPKEDGLHLIKSVSMTSNYVSHDAKVTKQKYKFVLWDGQEVSDVDITDLPVLRKLIPLRVVEESTRGNESFFRVKLTGECYAGEGVKEITVSSKQIA